MAVPTVYVNRIIQEVPTIESVALIFVGADAHISPIDHREGTGRCGHRPLHFYFNAYAANYDLS